MKVLILEDDLYRISLFRRKLHRHELTFTDRVSVAKAMIEKNEYDYIFLDHDLDNRQYVNSEEENTGYQLCRWLATDKVQMNRKFKTIIIHSMNEVGSRNMFDTLQTLKTESVQRIPFHVLLDSLET